MPTTAFDHLVVIAPTRESGVRWVTGRVGVEPVEGGAHSTMGTHNALLRLGDRAYLEVIAVDPRAARPPRPRWFDLDRLAPGAAPRLATWVARTSDVRAAASASPVPPGPVEPMSRGSLAWSITIPQDGGLLLDGAAPLLIEWPDGVHPATSLPESGCSLEALEIHHPQVRLLERMLDAIGFAGALTFVPSSPDHVRLAAVVGTPFGARRLESAVAGFQSPWPSDR